MSFAGRVSFTVCVLAVAASAGVSAGQRRSGPPGCNLGEPAAVLIRAGDQRAADGRMLVRWDVAEGPAWEGRADPPGPAYRSFKNELMRRGVNTDPKRALARSPTVNNEVVLAHADMWIRPATCLEKQMFGLQYARIPSFDEPTEFAAFVLSSADGARLRIYWYSVNRNGIGSATPLTGPVGADVARGWRVRFALHSHPFKPSDDKVNGIVSPSEPDAQFQRNVAGDMGLPEARITNGVDTVQIPASAFGLFDAE